jgi:Cu(I)/Ag(I) efflux system membrane fusion protein
MKLTTILALLAALLLTGCEDITQATQSKEETAVEHAVKHLDPNYVCPMHPQIIRGKPGSCPICGMDLVAVENEPDGDVTVEINPALVNSLGVRTAVAEKGRLWRMIDTVGYIDVDESLISHIHLRTEGWIEKLYISAEGDRVSKGDRLFDLYSPALINAQEEYVEALRSGNQRLIRSSRDRLKSLDISGDQIDALKRTRKVSDAVTYYASQDGIVTSLKTPEGMFVKPATRVLSLVDLSRVWVQVEVFEQQANWVAVGQPAEMQLSFLPGRQWDGEVAYVYPELDARTRTLRVRLQFDNPEEALKPNMYANVRLYAGPRDGVLIIPSQALIDSGREVRVIIDQGDGRYAPRKVAAGMQSGDFVEIVSGLDEGDRVVVSGQFLIDSEASLKASLQRMQGGE